MFQVHTRWKLAYGAGLAILLAGAWSVVGWDERRVPALNEARAVPPTAQSGPDSPSLAGAATEARASRAAVPSSGTRPTALSVRVVDEQGRPWAGARVLILGGPTDTFSEARRRNFTEATTDSRGRVTFKLADQAGGGLRSLVVSVEGRVPVVQTLDAPAGERVITVSDELTLSGIVRVDGGTPPSPIELEVRGFDLPGASFDGGSRALLSQHEVDLECVRVRTRSNGSFEVHGLPSGQLVSVAAPLRYELAGGGPAQITALTGDQGLRLELIASPVLRFSIVRAPGLPEAPEDLWVQVEGEDFEGRPQSAAVGSGPGRVVELPLRRGLARLELSVRAGKGGALLAHRSWWAPLPAFASPVEIEVPETSHALRLLVLDSSGYPLPGALAAAEGQRAGPALLDGLLLLELRSATQEVAVGGPGRQSVLVPFPWPPPPSLTVRLGPANSLTVVVEGGAGDVDPSALGVHLQVTQERRWPGRALRGTAPEPQLRPDGTWLATDLPANVPFVVSLRDHHSHTLRCEKIRLAPGEARELVWRANSSAQTLSGRVVDANGDGIARAALSLGGTLGPNHWTDEEGWFEVSEVLDPEPALRIGAPGFVDLDVSGPSLFFQDVFVLERSRSLWIEVRDADGPVDVEELRLELDDGSTRIASREGLGLYRLGDVPRRRGTVFARGPDGALTIGATETRVRLGL